LIDDFTRVSGGILGTGAMSRDRDARHVEELRLKER
jgi:hypothetical protein